VWIRPYQAIRNYRTLKLRFRIQASNTFNHTNLNRHRNLTSASFESDRCRDPRADEREPDVAILTRITFNPERRESR